MTVRFATPEEISQWNDLLLKNPDGGNIFQSYQIATVKQQSGWIARFLIAGQLAITVHERAVPGVGKLWYAPKGPGITSVEQLADILDDLTAFAKKRGVFAVKIEPELPADESIHEHLSNMGLRKVRAIQPNSSTVVIDTTPNLEEIKAGLHQKGRHAINRAARDGVTAKIMPVNDENCKIMYNLLKETAAGQWRMRSYEYYKAFWESFSRLGRGHFFFAYVDGVVVASAYSVLFGTKGTYKDGASVRERSVYGASHLLQWEIIEWMKLHGAVSYDLCGVPPSNAIKDETHPHYGLGRFKTSFNKEVTDYIGAYDIVVKPLKYKVWERVGERATIRLHSYRFGEYWY